MTITAGVQDAQARIFGRDAAMGGDCTIQDQELSVASLSPLSQAVTRLLLLAWKPTSAAVDVI